MKTTMYLIDGVRVSQRTWKQRRIWGEYVGADFRVIEIRQREKESR
jgi:hypothetical protein